MTLVEINSENCSSSVFFCRIQGRLLQNMKNTQKFGVMVKSKLANSHKHMCKLIFEIPIGRS